VTEENKYLDELFQSKFAGFEAEPPASAWNNIHDKLHGNNGGSVNPVNLSMLAALILISGLLGFSIIGDVPEQSHEIDPAYLSDLYISNDIPSENTFSEPAVNMPENTRTPVQKPGNITDSEPAERTGAQPEANKHKAMHSAQGNSVYTPSFAEKARLAKMKNRRSLTIHAGLSRPEQTSISVRDSRTSPRFSAVNKGENAYKRNASWQVGAFFTPEVSFFNDDSIPNQRIYTFDVTARWKKNEFFIESGLGLSFSTDDGKYAIDYEQYLGTYDDVYNVTFDTTQSGDIVANYHTNEVNVYDSISQYKVDQTKNKYTYLQIPVYIGFQRQIDRFGWFVKGGPILSLMMNKNIPDPDAGYNRIIGLDQQIAGRVDMHWQMAFSLGITYQLSEKVSFALEPTFRYYLNSQYERKYITTRHPYSLGLRTGLLFNF
jgi:hypothetical protein